MTTQQHKAKTGGSERGDRPVTIKPVRRKDTDLRKLAHALLAQAKVETDARLDHEQRTKQRRAEPSTPAQEVA